VDSPEREIGGGFRSIKNYEAFQPEAVELKGRGQSASSEGRAIGGGDGLEILRLGRDERMKEAQGTRQNKKPQQQCLLRENRPRQEILRSRKKSGPGTQKCGFRLEIEKTS